MRSIKLFADGAVLAEMVEANRVGLVDGFTTNPTLMRKAGIDNYETFAKAALAEITERPICLEVFADEFEEMYRQATKIAAWGENVYVKIPVTNTNGESSAPLISRLAHEGMQLNVTGILTLDQVRTVTGALETQVPAIVSIFAGRIADTGCDPVPLVKEALEIVKRQPRAELLWASPREVLNVYQAEACGCHIITVSSDLLKKLPMHGKDLGELSRETVQMFHDDARAAGYTL